jgi:hypothetical protein
MHFDYVLYDAGWAEVRITANRRTVRMLVSYLHDSLLELVNALLQLQQGASKAKVVFMDEPGEHQLLLTCTEGETLSLEVRWYRDWASWGMQSPDEYETRLETSTTVSTLNEQAIEALNAILDTFGTEGYRKKWALHHFPIDEFQRLQKFACRYDSSD